MSIQCRFASAADAKKAGWFSRRHETSGAHLAAQFVYRAEREQKAFREEHQREQTAAWTGLRVAPKERA